MSTRRRSKILIRLQNRRQQQDSSYLMGKRRRGSRRINDNDRISRLPEELKAHILSVLPYSDSVKTTILSRRWKHLWAFTTSLHFSDELCFASSTTPATKKVRDFFLKYVDKVLNLRESDEAINKFTISVSVKYDTFRFYRICKWVDWATRRKVKILDFSVHLGNNERVPFYQFHNFTSIVDLRMSGISIIVSLDAEKKTCLSLPNVKSLNLHNVQFTDNLEASKFFCNCPILEELDICNPTTNSSDVFKLCIPAPKLKRLKVQCKKRCHIRVYASCLEFLLFKGYDWKNIRLEHVPPLVEAHIYLNRKDGGNHIAYDDYRRKILKRFKVMATVELLSIDFSFVQTSDNNLPFFGKDFPIFHNLESLKLRTNSHGRRLLCQVLEHAPKLKHLSLSVKPSECKCEVGHYWRLPLSLPSCLLSCLECMEVIFTSKEDILDFLKEVLKNATVLKNMKISAPLMWIGDLLMFPCASTACQILPLSGQELESSSADFSSSDSSSSYDDSDDDESQDDSDD